MESVNQTLKSVLHVITVLQDICDKRRIEMEMQDSEEYHAFLREWKRKRITKLCPKENDLNQVKKETEVKALVDDMEEIALVDSLLQKARNIRLKYKDSTKPFHDSASNPLSKSPNSIPKPHAFECHQKKELYISTQINYKKVLPRSKSALPSTRLKTVVVPRSKSANVHLVPKEEKSPRNNRITTKVNSKKSAISITSKQNECKISDESNSVISNNELKDFKKSYVIYNVCDKKLEEIENASEIITSDFPQDSHPNSFPTYRGFQSELKQVSSLKSFFQLHRGSFWYPFLSSKHRNFLLCQRNLTSLGDLAKAFELMHKIQETMVWIDLLALVGRDALPKVVLLDENDLNVIRLCYYLESLYSKNLQRLPLLDPN